MNTFSVPATPFRFERRVRWGECDPAGVVYTPRFSDYVAEAFNDFMEHVLEGPVQERQPVLDVQMPAKALQLLFKRSLYPEQLFSIEVRVAGIRNRSFDLAMTAFDNDNQEVFTALLSLVCVYHKVRESRTIPELMRQRLEAYRDRFPATVAS